MNRQDIEMNVFKTEPSVIHPRSRKSSQIYKKNLTFPAFVSRNPQGGLFDISINRIIQQMIPPTPDLTNYNMILYDDPIDALESYIKEWIHDERHAYQIRATGRYGAYVEETYNNIVLFLLQICEEPNALNTVSKRQKWFGELESLIVEYLNATELALTDSRTRIQLSRNKIYSHYQYVDLSSEDQAHLVRQLLVRTTRALYELMLPYLDPNIDDQGMFKNFKPCKINKDWDYY